MRLSELAELERPPRYRVAFERRENGVLVSDRIPDHCEPALASEEDAWFLAGRVANAVRNAVNIYVVRADTHTPVPGYRERMLRRHPMYL